MNEHIFSLIKQFLRGKNPALLWLAVHGGVLLALGLSLPVCGPVRINGNLFDLLPAAPGLREAALADKTLGERSSRQAIVLAAGEDFAETVAAAEAMRQRLAGDGAFESISLYVDPSTVDDVMRFLREHRYALLDGETRRLLESGRAGEIAADALAAVYGAFSLGSLDYLDEDPFLLANRELNHLLAASLSSAGAMSLRGNVLAARQDNTWYVLIRIVLSPGGASLTNKNSGVRKIYAARDAITGARFVCSGAPFHTYESSSSAQREISLISTVTLILIVLLFVLIFRSLLPILAAVSAAACSVLLALAAALLCFREIHLLTFVFGTTLIGTCVDYTIHFFIHRNMNPRLADGSAVRAAMFKSVSLSFVSSCVCFALLLFAPFAILKQFAVFSLAGLSSSYLTVMCVYPLLGRKTGGFRLVNAAARKPFFPKLAGLLALAGLLLILLFVNRGHARVENNIASLYAMRGELLEGERTVNRVMNIGSAGWYFIVSGSNPEETLQTEERLCAALDAEIAGGGLGAYTALSVVIPSEKTQDAQYRAAEQLLPLAGGQYAALGLSPEAAERFTADFFKARAARVRIGAALPPYLAELVSSLWIGPLAGRDGQTRYYSVVLPLHATSEAPFRAIAAGQDGVYFVNKAADIGAELDRLTRIMLALLVSALVLIAVLARRCYPWGKALRICAVPLLLALAVLAVLACLRIPLGFFAVVGLLLVFGLGLDYMFYNTEAARNAADDTGRSLTALGILLSFATTALSFGALALSGFAPVHIFGLTVFAGLCAAYISAMLLAE